LQARRHAEFPFRRLRLHSQVRRRSFFSLELGFCAVDLRSCRKPVPFRVVVVLLAS
jgi:hypothetical protein